MDKLILSAVILAASSSLCFAQGGPGLYGKESGGVAAAQQPSTIAPTPPAGNAATRDGGSMSNPAARDMAGAIAPPGPTTPSPTAPPAPPQGSVSDNSSAPPPGPGGTGGGAVVPSGPPPAVGQYPIPSPPSSQNYAASTTTQYSFKCWSNWPGCWGRGDIGSKPANRWCIVWRGEASGRKGAKDIYYVPANTREIIDIFYMDVLSCQTFDFMQAFD